jgi:hypothetical protein
LRRIHAADVTIAEYLAASLGTTLEAHGLARAGSALAVLNVAASAAPAAGGHVDPGAVRAYVDAALLAAAEALDVSPRKLRPAAAELVWKLARLRMRMEDVATLVASRA